VRTVVVTGVAGSLGQRVAARLAARSDVDRIVGIDVFPPGWSHPKLDVRIVDLAVAPEPDDELVAVLEDSESVIHLAWRTSGNRGHVARQDASVSRSNRGALERVLAAAAITRPQSLVHLSSATVYGAWPDNQIPLTEDAPLRPNAEFPYAVGKAEAERALAEWTDDHPEVRVAVLRPAVTVGSEEPLYEALGATRAPGAGNGHRPVQYLHVDDLADAVVVVWDQRLSGVFNVAPDTGVREDAARALAGGVARVTLPDRLSRAVAAWSWQLWRRGVPAEARAYATHPWVVAPDRLKAVGWKPKYTSEEAIVATDMRVHWDDLPPGRRQNYNLLLALAGAVGIAAAAVTIVAAWGRRRGQQTFRRLSAGSTPAAGPVSGGLFAGTRSSPTGPAWAQHCCTAAG
jgi:UDP-glucose 4-epimerase